MRRPILGALERTNWKVSGPEGRAEASGIKGTTLQARIKKQEIVRRR